MSCIYMCIYNVYMHICIYNVYMHISIYNVCMYIYIYSIDRYINIYKYIYTYIYICMKEAKGLLKEAEGPQARAS